MAYPSKFEAIEKKFGKPIGEILVIKLNELGNIVQVSRDPDIDMSYDKVYGKVKECGILKDPPRWRLPEAEHAE